MNEVLIELDDGTVQLAVADRRFVIMLTPTNGTPCGVALNPAKAHVLLEAISKFLAETP